MITIYKVTNKLNGKVYIGQTKNAMQKRWLAHINGAFNEGNSTHRSHLQYAIRKHTLDAFSIEQIDSCECPKEANKKEMQHINAYESYDTKKGYNLTRGGDNFNWLVNPMSVAKSIQTRKANKRNRHESTSPFLGVYWDEERDSWRVEIKRDGKLLLIKRGYLKDSAAALARDMELVKVIEDRAECVMYMNYPDRYDDIKSGKVQTPKRRMKRTLKMGTLKGVQWDKTERQWYTVVRKDGKSIKRGMWTSETEAAIASDYLNVGLGNPISHLNYPERLDEYKDPSFKLPPTMLQAKKTCPYRYVSLNRVIGSYQVDNRCANIGLTFRKQGFKTAEEAKTWRDTQYTANGLAIPD